jgi:hypothetical protein
MRLALEDEEEEQVQAGQSPAKEISLKQTDFEQICKTYDKIRNLRQEEDWDDALQRDFDMKSKDVILDLNDVMGGMHSADRKKSQIISTK